MFCNTEFVKSTVTPVVRLRQKNSASCKVTLQLEMHQ